MRVGHLVLFIGILLLSLFLLSHQYGFTLTGTHKLRDEDRSSVVDFIDRVRAPQLPE
jgi:hypothetical protein